MNSYQSIQAARDAAAKNPNVKFILEIEPGQPGVGLFVCSLASAERLQQQLSRKPMKEIKAVVRTAVDLAEERAAAKAALLAMNVPGLEELMRAIAEERRYHKQFDRMMEDGDNDGAMPPSPRAGRTSAVQFPIAAAYIKAERWFYASHFVKSGAGRRAMERIMNGESYAAVIAEMEKEWSDYCSEQI